jgi:NarL family two-component system response regulator LiaR
MSAARPAARRRPAAGPPAPTTVLLVDDQAVIRKGIRVLLDQSPGILVVGEARDGVEGVAMTRRLDPDVVLMDIGMPNMNGIEATARLRDVAPRSRVLILSAHSDDHYIRAVMAMGAVGYVLKQSTFANLARAIRDTARGGTVVSAQVRKRLQALRAGPRHVA